MKLRAPRGTYTAIIATIPLMGWWILGEGSHPLLGLLLTLPGLLLTIFVNVGEFPEHYFPEYYMNSTEQEEVER